MSTATIAFIGGGNMAVSLIGGLVSQGYDAGSIRASDPLEASRDRLANEFGITTSDDNAVICRGADVVVLAVKPQILGDVARGLAPAIAPGAVVVSIAAGIPMAALQQWLGPEAAIVRCMPNTPSLVHQGVSGLFANAAVTERHKATVGALFEAVGIAAWLDSERDLEAVTALSGSGPAYFFYLMELMEQEGIRLGLDAATARRFTLQTALGAATMAAGSDTDAAELRRRVSSPGGTTEQAIRAFEQGDLQELVRSAMEAAATRARQMADELTR